MRSKKIIYLLSFVLPLAVMLAMCVERGVQPFGDNSLLIIDGLHQYMPFFSILQDKLKSGGSLFYTFRAGLGLNFLSLFSYYLSSPLNLVVLFVKKTQLNMAISMLIVLKIALSGLTSGIYFTHRYAKAGKEPSLSVLMAAMCYALNGYMVGYCWNVMWLDAIMIFPIIMLGLEKLIDERDGRLYALALFYALYCNYYIGFMICIFLVIWYVLYAFQSIKQFFTRALPFAFWSAVAGGMAAVVLVPAYLGIKQTAAGGTMSLPPHSFFAGWFNLLARQYNLAGPISHDNFDGNANLYFGIFTLVLVVIYLFNRQISLWEKCKRVAMIALFYVSFNEAVLNFIWHGFHDQYGIPNRFSFLYGFLLLYMVVETWIHREGSKWQHSLIAGIVVGAGLLVSFFKASDKMDSYLYLAVGLMIAVYMLLMIGYCIDKSRRQLYGFVFCLGAMAEMGVSCLMGFTANGQILVPKFFSGTEDMQKAVSAEKDPIFSRSELASNKMVNENAWYDLNSVGLFGSTAMNHTVDIMDSLGFYTGANEYLYKGATPLTNLLFDVKRIYFHEDDTMMTNFKYKKSYGNFDVYVNPQKNMSLGYLVGNDVSRWFYTSAYPFRVLNSFSETGYGIPNLFRDVPVQDPIVKGCTVKRTNDGEYYFKFKKKQSDNMAFVFHTEREMQHFYLNYDGTQVANAEIAVNGKVVQSGDIDGYILPMGDIPAGATITATFELLGETPDGYVRVSAANMDQELYDQLADKMTSHSLKLTKVTDTEIEGTVTAGKGQKMMMSIPYDPGWTVLVDGVKVKTTKVGDAFLAFPLKEGYHDVSLSYIPGGFATGWQISLASLILYLLGSSVILKRKRLEAEQTKPVERKAEKATSEDDVRTSEDDMKVTNEPLEVEQEAPVKETDSSEVPLAPAESSPEAVECYSGEVVEAKEQAPAEAHSFYEDEPDYVEVELSEDWFGDDFENIEDIGLPKGETEQDKIEQKTESPRDKI